MTKQMMRYQPGHLRDRPVTEPVREGANSNPTATLTFVSDDVPIGGGAEYLDSIPTDQRRLTGRVYTPLYLADFILDQAGYAPGEAIEQWNLVDPSCGAGAFLVVAVRRLVARLERLGMAPSSPDSRRIILGFVSRNIYGVDIDARACDLARAAVRTELARLLGAAVSPTFFARNIVRADYLLGFRSERMSPRLRHGIDLIVGNPPYVATTRIKTAYKNRLRDRFRTASGRLDLYTLFMERSLALLSRRGRMAFITPNKFLVSVTSRPLRALLAAQGTIRTIVNFRSHKVFDDAATVPCIMVLERGAREGAMAVLECDGPSPNGGASIVTRSAIDRTQLGEGPWHLTGGNLRALGDAIRRDHPSLGMFTSRVSAGLATGRDQIYVLPAMLAANIEPELRRRAVRGRDLAAYEISDPGLEIIVPYVYDAAGRPQLVDLDQYPRARAYLDDYRATLKQRHACQVWDKAWYDLHDPVPFDLAARSKILVPDIARSNRFAFDPGRYCPLHSVYYLIPKDIDPVYLTAILNSTIVEFLIRLLAPVMKDGFSRYRRQFLLELPVPVASGPQAQAITEAARVRDHLRLENLVTTLFGVSRSERNAMTRFLSTLTGQEGKQRARPTGVRRLDGS